jgi:hypothetical protein
LHFVRYFDDEAPLFRSGKDFADDYDMSESAPSPLPGRPPAEESRSMREVALPQLDLVDRDATGESARPWLGVWYKCANKYVKVFRSADGTTYTARCPKCGEATRFRVGEGGVSSRFFEIQC